MGNKDWTRRIYETLSGDTVDSADFHTKVALGTVEGVTLWHKWGYNLDVDTASEEFIWEPGGTKTFLGTGETLGFSSTSASDVNGGVGAHGVVVYGVDENRASVVEVVFLNGISTVTTTNQFLGVNRVALFRSGSSLSNVGKISAISTDTSNLEATIPAGSGSTQQAIFYTAPDTTALAGDLLINVNKTSGGSSPKVTVRGYTFSFLSNSRYEVFRHTIDASVENTILYNPERKFAVGVSSVLYFTAETDTNNTSLSVRFSVEEFMQ